MRGQGKIREPYLQMIFVLIALALIYHFAKIPDEINLSILTFLAIMAVFDRINLKVFSGFGYSFKTVILGLIIFDKYSMVYGLLYLLLDFLFIFISKSKERFNRASHVSLLSFYIIIVILCNEFYNEYSNKEYMARYITLLLIVFLTISLRYVYSLLETGKITTKFFLDIFGPMVVEVLIIFPILAFFDQLHVNLVLILYLSYYTFTGFLHQKFLGINQQQFSIIVNKIEEKYGVKVYITDLGEVKGACYPKKKMIFIDEKIDYPEQLQTLIHESLHYRIRGQFNFSKQIEEIIVTIFEAIISWYYIITLKAIPELD